MIWFLKLDKKYNNNTNQLQQSTINPMKTKPISKSHQSNASNPRSPKPKKPATTPQGDPIISTLSDFSTSLKISFTNKPIYTGGRLQPCHIDGRLSILSICNEQIVVFFVEENKITDRIGEKGEEIVNFCVSWGREEGRYVVTCGRSGMIRVYARVGGTYRGIFMMKLGGNGYANDMQFSPNSKYLALALGNTVHIYTLSAPSSSSLSSQPATSQISILKRTHTYNPTNSKLSLTKLAWHPDQNRLQLFTCDMQKNLVLFDYIVNKVVGVAKNGGNQFCVCQGQEGEYVVVLDGLNVRVLGRDLKEIWAFQTQQYFQSVAVVDNQLYLGGQETDLYSLTLPQSFTKAKPMPQLKKHKNSTDSGVSKIFLVSSHNSTKTTQSNQSSFSRKLFVLSTQQNLTILRIAKNASILQYQSMIVGYNDQIIDIKNSKPNPQNSNKYFIMVTNSNNVKIFYKNFQLEQTQPQLKLQQAPQMPTNMQITPKLSYLIKGHENIVLCCDFWYPYIVTGGKDNTAKLWKIFEKEKGVQVQLIANYTGHSGDIVSLAILPNSKLLATVSEDLTLKLWTLPLSTSRSVTLSSSLYSTPAHSKPINSLKYSHCQSFIATCSQDRSIKIWSLFPSQSKSPSLSLLFTLFGHKRSVWDMAFHPVEKILVSVGGQGMVKGWSLQNGECLYSIGEGMGLVRCGWMGVNQLVTGSIDGIVKVWDVRKQTSIAYDKHQGKIWALDVGKSVGYADRVEIWTGATDSTMHIWADNTSQLKNQILHDQQLQQKQKIFYQQNMQQGNYFQGAKIAFKAGYLKLFMGAIEKIGVHIDGEEEVIEEEGKIVIRKNQEEKQEKGNENMDFEEMVGELMEFDVYRLLTCIQTMISTIKHYKAANRLLLSLFKQKSFTQLLEFQHAPSHKFLAKQTQSTQQMLQELTQKKSGFKKLLESILSFQQRHLIRMDKYLKGGYWVEELYRRENPYLNQNLQEIRDRNQDRNGNDNDKEGVDKIIQEEKMEEENQNFDQKNTNAEIQKRRKQILKKGKAKNKRSVKKVHNQQQQ